MTEQSIVDKETCCTQALNAVTINASHALGLGQRRGSLAARCPFKACLHWMVM